jgi:hypothetical protein
MAPQSAAESEPGLQAPLLPQILHRDNIHSPRNRTNAANVPAGDAVHVSLQEQQQQQQQQQQQRSSVASTVRGTHWLLTTAIMLSDMFGLGWVHKHIYSTKSVMCRSQPRVQFV